MNVSISRLGSRTHPEGHGLYDQSAGTLEITQNERLPALSKGVELRLLHGGQEMHVEILSATGDPDVFSVKSLL